MSMPYGIKARDVVNWERALRILQVDSLRGHRKCSDILYSVCDPWILSGLPDDITVEEDH